MRFVDWAKIFDFSTADPPAYYLLGRGLLKVIGSSNRFLFTISILQAAVNTLALGWFALLFERRFQSPIVHASLILFLAFLPVRMIHSATLGTDWTTIPLFVLVLFCLDKLLSEKGLTVRNAAYLGLALALGVWSKYSFVALLPAVFVILAFFWWRGALNLKSVITICALSLVLPSALVLYSHRESSRVPGSMARNIWAHGEGVDMDYKDLFSVKVKDAELFKAPEAFKVEIALPHEHSYLGLSHYGIFTDPMNLFQDLPVELQQYSPYRAPNEKARRAWKTPVMVASMSLGVLWTLFALIGTPWALFRAGRNLWKVALEREDLSVLLGTAFFLLMFLPIPFVVAGARYGFWTPRLILPPLLCFSLAAFLFLEKKVVRGSRMIAFGVLFLVVIQCVIEIVMLA